MEGRGLSRPGWLDRGDLSPLFTQLDSRFTPLFRPGHASVWHWRVIKLCYKYITLCRFFSRLYRTYTLSLLMVVCFHWHSLFWVTVTLRKDWQLENWNMH